MKLYQKFSTTNISILFYKSKMQFITFLKFTITLTSVFRRNTPTTRKLTENSKLHSIQELSEKYRDNTISGTLTELYDTNLSSNIFSLEELPEEYYDNQKTIEYRVQQIFTSIEKDHYLKNSEILPPMYYIY